MKKKFILIGLAMSGFALSQNNCPNIQDISWVLDDNGEKYVVSLTNDGSALNPDGKGPQEVPLVPCTLAIMLVLGSN